MKPLGRRYGFSFSVSCNLPVRAWPRSLSVHHFFGSDGEYHTTEVALLHVFTVLAEPTPLAASTTQRTIASHKLF